jgi:hypothetical protein
MTRAKPRIGDVVEFKLPGGRSAYGRVMRDATVGFYRTGSDERHPPIGSRNYQFVVGVYDDVLTSDQCQVVGHDPSRDPEDDWPPPMCIQDSISGGFSLYHKGEIRPATKEECEGLESAAVWDYEHLVERLSQPTDS